MTAHPPPARVLTLHDKEILTALRAGHSVDYLAEVGWYRRSWSRADVERLADEHALPPPPPRHRPGPRPKPRLVPTVPTWTPPGADEPPVVVTIPPRIAQVLTGICEGLSNGEIADRHGIAEHTVKTHIKRLFRLLGARDRAHAAALACTGRVRLTIAGRTVR